MESNGKFSAIDRRDEQNVSSNPSKKSKLTSSWLSCFDRLPSGEVFCGWTTDTGEKSGHLHDSVLKGQDASNLKRHLRKVAYTSLQRYPGFHCQEQEHGICSERS